MRKLLFLVVAMVLLVSPAINVSAQELDSSEELLKIHDYNELFADASEVGNMVTLDEYNCIYGGSTLNYQNEGVMELSGLSGIKKQTKDIILNSNGTKVGTITLEYQTIISGGRPQFVYDTCKLSHPNLNTYWNLDTSKVDFSGDKIGVYFSFSFVAFQDDAWVYFRP